MEKKQCIVNIIVLLSNQCVYMRDPHWFSLNGLYLCFLSCPDAHPCLVITLFRMIPVSRMFNNQSFDMLTSCSHIGVCVTLPAVVPSQHWNMLECVHPAAPSLAWAWPEVTTRPVEAPGQHIWKCAPVSAIHVMMCSADPLCSSSVIIPEHYKSAKKKDFVKMIFLLVFECCYISVVVQIIWILAKQQYVKCVWASLIWHSTIINCN